MQRVSLNNLFPVLSSVAGYAFLAWLFLQALLHPTNYLDLVYGGGVTIFIIEFLNIHSSGMLMGGKDRGVAMERNWYVLLFFYAVFAFFLLFVSNKKSIVLFFLISLFSKIVAQKTTPDVKRTVLSTILLLATTFAVAVSAKTLNTLIPFPQSVLMSAPENQSGLFVDTPQTILVWGVMYCVGMGIMELFLFLKER